MACVVISGAADSVPDTATLPPTQAIPPAPAHHGALMRRCSPEPWPGRQGQDGGKREDQVPGVDFLQLNAADAPRGGIATWLTDALRAAIGDGRLTAGDRLPPSRGMATGLGVSRGVVVEAYQRLVDEGLAVTEGARGPRVAAVPRPAPTAAPATPTSRQDRVDLSPGLPDLSA